jgi:hypothetical protein
MIRIGNDWYFDQSVVNTKIRVQITHDCVVDALGSDGSEHGSLEVLGVNRDRLEVLAIRKALNERTNPIVITAEDIVW